MPKCSHSSHNDPVEEKPKSGTRWPLSDTNCTSASCFSTLTEGGLQCVQRSAIEPRTWPRHRGKSPPESSPGPVGRWAASFLTPSAGHPATPRPSAASERLTPRGTGNRAWGKKNASGKNSTGLMPSIRGSVEASQERRQQKSQLFHPCPARKDAGHPLVTDPNTPGRRPGAAHHEREERDDDCDTAL